MFDQLKIMFGESLTIPDASLWTFCEIVKTIYTLKKAAEVFYLGGSHTSQNPDKDTLKNPEYVEHINAVLIPMQIHSMYKILAECGAADYNWITQRK
jgi:hypothetical protein